ncbi:unnamed protein product [Prorocentrum cordatum]|uniref:Uncharacterized protein n=1 Tax=Prorocentrum cordatum TaxID=2364126 RepID=A0ABN9RDI6_9DINO|nr:unnamed protein product [Polarella glacialis]
MLTDSINGQEDHIPGIQISLFAVNSSVRSMEAQQDAVERRLDALETDCIPRGGGGATIHFVGHTSGGSLFCLDGSVRSNGKKEGFLSRRNQIRVRKVAGGPDQR